MHYSTMHHMLHTSNVITPRASILGIDFGAKTAGTTVAAAFDGTKTSIHAVCKGEDADIALEEILRQCAPSIVCIDAPLGIPGVYRGIPGCTDYFYRECDKRLRAMSPMFLGGLTARAMRLAASVRSTLPNIQLLETYPAAQARRLLLNTAENKGEYKGRKEFIPTILQAIECAVKPHSTIPIPKELPDWHSVDAVLALIAAERYASGAHELYGTAEEGMIVV
jgi:uncharacterized protein